MIAGPFSPVGSKSGDNDFLPVEKYTLWFLVFGGTRVRIVPVVVTNELNTYRARLSFVLYVRRIHYSFKPQKRCTFLRLKKQKTNNYDCNYIVFKHSSGKYLWTSTFCVKHIMRL